MSARASGLPTGVVAKFHEMALLGMVAAGYFALAGYLDWPTAAVTFAALALRVLMIAGLIRFQLPPKLVASLAVICLIFYPLDERFLSDSFLIATVHLVCFLAAIKILTASTRRDYAWVRVIALLELLSASMLSSSPSFFAFLAMFLLCTIAAFSSAEILRSLNAPEESAPRNIARSSFRLFPRRLAVLSSGLFLGILLMTAGLFLVLPRTARAALQRFVPQRYHLPGFSNEISLGDIGEIKQRSTPVMHARAFLTDNLNGLRWRGAALTHFDGKRWFNPPGRETPLQLERTSLTLIDPRNPPIGRALRYQVQLSEIASDTLFFAGTPATIQINLPFLRRTSGGAIRVPRADVTGMRYGVYAILEEERGPTLRTPEVLSSTLRSELLELPRLDRRISRLAREMAIGTATQEAEARAIEQHLRRDFGYTLELPQTESADPLAYFLFERKKGHCEYFASAMAVMLRYMGIPSRVATGFLGGVYNPVTGWQVIRASDAHSWVEAWIDGRGWVTFDPTPPDPGASPTGVISGFALLSDAIGQLWQDWVLSYDIERQIVLASRIEASGRRLRLDWISDLGSNAVSAGRVVAGHVVSALLILGIAAALIVFGPSLRRWLAQWLRLRRVQRGAAQASDATLLYSKMLDVLERRGFRKPPWVTPIEFARMLPASEISRLVDHMTIAYNQCRFGGRSEAASQMIDLLDQIEASPTRR
jgi:protein-glutamine gamma-glutamyltransferase